MLDELVVREVQYTISAKGQRKGLVTIATTLLDPALYSKETIAELYGGRWQVETHFAELKTTLKMRKLRSKTPEGVLKVAAQFVRLPKPRSVRVEPELIITARPPFVGKSR